VCLVCSSLLANAIQSFLSLRLSARLKEKLPYHSHQRKGLIDKDHHTHGWLQSISSPDEKSS
jgi:hypothetical protein